MASQTLYQLSKRYGKALIASAATPVLQKDFWQDWGRLKKIIDNDPKGWRMLTGPLVPREKKNKVLLALTEKLSLHPFMQGFLKTLVRYGRLQALPAIMERFQKEMQKLGGKKYGTLITAIPLSRAHIQKTEALLADKMGHEILLTHQVDPSLLGGAIVSWEGFWMDGSLATTLNLFSQRLQKGR